MSSIKNMNRYVLPVYIALYFLCAASGVFAQLTNTDLPNRNGIKIGEIKGHSALRVTEQFDSNIFLSNTNRQADAITVISPSAGVEIPFRDSSISADYQTDIWFYGTYNSQNHMDQYVRALVEMPLKDFIVTVKDSFSIVTSRADNENSARIRQNNNDMRAGIAAKFDLLEFDAGYTNRLETYASNDFIIAPNITYEDKNRFNNIFDATVSYRFMPKTSLFLENLLGFIDYYLCGQVPNSIYDQAALGIKGEWFKKADVNFKAGFRYQGYDSSDIIADKAYTGAIIGGGMNYRPTDEDAFALNLLRTVYESTYANMNYYITNFAGLAYTHRFTDKLSGGLFGSYELHQYPSESSENGLTAKRHDNYYVAGLSLRYDMRKWVSFEARYQFKDRISNFDTYDYFDNLATVRGTVGF